MHFSDKRREGREKTNNSTEIEGFCIDYIAFIIAVLLDKIFIIADSLCLFGISILSSWRLKIDYMVIA